MNIIISYDKYPNMFSKNVSDEELFQQKQEVIDSVKSSQFFDSQVMEVSPKINGLRFNEDTQKIIIPINLGPTITNNVFYHELAHCIDFALRGLPERIKGFSFSYPQIELLGDFYDEPMTSQAVRNEIRVSGYEKILLMLDNFQVTDKMIKESADSLRFMPDHTIYEYTEKNTLEDSIRSIGNICNNPNEFVKVKEGYAKVIAYLKGLTTA